MNTELKPCPFCGKQPNWLSAYIWPHTWHKLKCCVVEVEGYEKEDAVTKWNSRVPPSPVEVGGEVPTAEEWLEKRWNVQPDESLYEVMKAVKGDHISRDELVYLLDEYGKELLGLRGATRENIGEYLARQIEWSRKTFGEGKRVLGITKHIRKELEEVEAAPSDLREWIDVVILALDGFWRNGGKPEEVFSYLQKKQDLNFTRVYPFPVSEDEPSEHLRGAGEPPAGNINLRTFAYRWFALGRSQEKPYTDKPEDFETLWARDKMIPRGATEWPAENNGDARERFENRFMEWAEEFIEPGNYKVLALRMSTAWHVHCLESSSPSGVEKKYEELLYAVGNKYPNETRHETALRYIVDAERPRSEENISSGVEKIKEERDFWFDQFNDRYPDEVAAILKSQRALSLLEEKGGETEKPFRTEEDIAMKRDEPIDFGDDNHDQY